MKKKYDYLIVGAGFSGSVIAERLAYEHKKKVLLVEKRNHIGGNAYDYYDKNGILVHKYGPHIFHTKSKIVFDYLSSFTKWKKYEHKVLANHKGINYPFPINRLTLNKLYKLNLVNEEETKEYIKNLKETLLIKNAEDYLISILGIDLYEIFYKYYSIKQWGIEPKYLDKNIFKRIPIRTDDDCRYFADKYQFMPEKGFTFLFGNILNHKNIDILLGTDYKEIIKSIAFDKLIYTGPIDYFFDYEYGKLPYRSIRFEFENIQKDKYLEAAVVNYVDYEIKYTRITDYKYFSNSKSNFTIISKEFPTDSGEEYYPIINKNNKSIVKKYLKKLIALRNVYFIGRLGEYKYYNMDQAILNAIKFSNNLK